VDRWAQTACSLPAAEEVLKRIIGKAR